MSSDELEERGLKDKAKGVNAVTTKRRTTQTNIKAPVNIAVDIRPGPSTPAMKASWHNWWQRIIGECKRELEADEREDKAGSNKASDGLGC